MRLRSGQSNIKRLASTQAPDGASFVSRYSPHWPEWCAHSIRPALFAACDFLAVEWKAWAYTLREAARQLEARCQRLGPRHSRIARRVTQYGHLRYFSGGVVISWEGLPKIIRNLLYSGILIWEFWHTFPGLHCQQGLLLSPFLAELGEMGFFCCQSSSRGWF